MKIEIDADKLAKLIEEKAKMPEDVMGNIVEKAESSSKQNAEQIAAKKILDKLGENNEF